MQWLIWIAVALLLMVVEVVSLELVILMFAGGALAAALMSALDVPLIPQIIVFGVVSSLLLFGLRPWMLRHLKKRIPLVETNVAAYIGKEATCLTDVTTSGGRLKLSGEVWSGRATAGSFARGDKVRVIEIDGAVAVVEDIKVAQA